MVRRILTVLAVASFFVFFFDFSFAQKKTAKPTTKTSDKIVVTGPKVKIEKDYTLFERTPDKRPVATKESNYIEADTIKFFSAKNYTISEGNVVYRNYEKNIEIKAGYSEFYGNTGDVVFEKSPMMYLSNNNLYAGGNKVFMNVNQDKVSVDGNVFITNENVRAFADKAEYVSKDNLSRMYGGVRIFSSNINIKSDTAFFSIFSNNISNYIGYGNVVTETKNILARSEYLFATFKNNNNIDKYVLMTNVVVDGKDLYVEAFKMVGVVSNVVDGDKTNEVKFYTFTGFEKLVFYKDKKEDSVLECEVLEVIMDENNEMISSTAKGKVKVIK
ncbi:MAG: hypothetical protein ACK4F9_01555 [Brevinematia bacterium]